MLYPDPEANREPSGGNTAERTQFECPSRVAASAPMVPSHSLAVASADPEASPEPSGENDNDQTELECPLRTAINDSNVVGLLPSRLFGECVGVCLLESSAWRCKAQCRIEM